MLAVAVVIITAAMLCNMSTAVLSVNVFVIISAVEATVLVSKQSGMLAVAVDSHCSCSYQLLRQLWWPLTSQNW